MGFQCSTNFGRHGGGLAGIGIKEYFYQFVGSMHFTGIYMLYGFDKRSTFSTDAGHTAINNNEITRDKFLDEVRGGTGRNRMYTEFLLHSLMTAPALWPDMKRSIIKKMSVPSHIHVPECIAVPWVNNAPGKFNGCGIRHDRI